MGIEVIGFDVSPMAREAALRSGAKQVADSGKDEDASATVQLATNGLGLDGSMVCAGVGPAYRQAIELTGASGYEARPNHIRLAYCNTKHV